MTNLTIDNSASEELGKVVLWQYDRAYNLLKILDYLGNWYTCGVEQFWNAYPKNVIGIDTANTFGLSVWGTFLGLPRPVYRVIPSGSTEAQHVSISDRLYANVLKSRFFLMKSSGAVTDIAYYLSVLFGCQHYSGMSGVFVEDLGEMAMEYSKNTNAPVLFRNGAGYAAGSVFAVVSIYRVLAGRSISSGTSWTEAKKSVEEEGGVACVSYAEGAAYSDGDIVEHEGLVYKCTEAIQESTSWDDDSDSFSQVNCFSESSSYAGNAEFCRIVPYVVKEDIEAGAGSQDLLSKASELEFQTTNEKTPLNTTFWDDMTDEQRLLFESANSVLSEYLADKLLDNARELLPYPAGIRFNTPFDEVVFGFAGQERQEMPDEEQLSTVFAEVAHNGHDASSYNGVEVDSELSQISISLGSSLTKYIADPKVGSFCEKGSSSVATSNYETYASGKSYNKGVILKNPSQGSDAPFVSATRYIGKSRVASTEVSDGRLVKIPEFSAGNVYAEDTYVSNGGKVYKLNRYISPAKGIETDKANGNIVGPLDGGSSVSYRKNVYELYDKPGGRTTSPSKIETSDDGTKIEFYYLTNDGHSYDKYEADFSTHGSSYAIGSTYNKDVVLSYDGNVYLCVRAMGTEEALSDQETAEEISSGSVVNYSSGQSYNQGSVVRVSTTGIGTTSTVFYVCSSYIGLSRDIGTEVSEGALAAVSTFDDTTFISQYLPSKWLGD